MVTIAALPLALIVLFTSFFMSFYPGGEGGGGGLKVRYSLSFVTCMFYYSATAFVLRASVKINSSLSIPYFFFTDLSGCGGA